MNMNSFSTSVYIVVCMSMEDIEQHMRLEPAGTEGIYNTGLATQEG